MSTNIQAKADLHKELALLLDYSSRLYMEYMNSNKQFLYAKLLYGVNRKIYDLINKNISYFNQDVKNDTIEILLHLDVWSSIWADEFESQSPSLKDSFIFTNEVNFPKESVKRLLADLLS